MAFDDWFDTWGIDVDEMWLTIHPLLFFKYIRGRDWSFWVHNLYLIISCC